MARPDVRDIQRDFRRLQLTERFNEGGRVGYALGSNPGMEPEIESLISLLRSVRNELKKLSLDGEFDIEIGDYAETQAPQTEIDPSMETPQVNPELVKNPMMENTNVMQTGLTPTEQALLSNEEKAIRLRQRGMG